MSYSVNKFYDPIGKDEGRATMMGFGKKVEIFNKHTQDPGRYQNETENRKHRKGFSFGIGR